MVDTDANGGVGGFAEEGQFGLVVSEREFLAGLLDVGAGGVVRDGSVGDGESHFEGLEAREAAFGATHPCGSGFQGDGFLCKLGWGGNGHEKGDVALVSIAGVLGHVGFLGIGPLDFRGGESLGEFPVDGGWHADHPGVLPIGVEAGEVLEMKTHREGRARGDAAVFGDEIDRNSWAFQACFGG